MFLGDTSIRLEPAQRQCQHCDRPLHHDQDLGWVHPEGSAYVMECPECGWVGEIYGGRISQATDICPSCKVVGKLLDNHVALPA